jgi:hydrogenase nickel incorporation protein HypB
MFRACDLVMVNKVDLLPHLDIDLDLLLHRIDKVHPDVPTVVVSGRTGAGVDAVRQWLCELHATRVGVRV